MPLRYTEHHCQQDQSDGRVHLWHLFIKIYWIRSPWLVFYSGLREQYLGRPNVSHHPWRKNGQRKNFLTIAIMTEASKHVLLTNGCWMISIKTWTPILCYGLISWYGFESPLDSHEKILTCQPVLSYNWRIYIVHISKCLELQLTMQPTWRKLGSSQRKSTGSWGALLILWT